MPNGSRRLPVQMASLSAYSGRLAEPVRHSS